MPLSSSFRFLPFSHTPGTWCLLPGSLLSCQVFPALVCVFDYSGKIAGAVRFPNLGPLKQFCVKQDLERGSVIVSGFSPSGFIRYSIQALDALSWRIESKKEIEMEYAKRSDSATYYTMSPPESTISFKDRERLFLGVDKSQEWPEVVRRGNMLEILPFWHFLAQSVAKLKEYPVSAEPSLLASVQNAKANDVMSHLKDLFLAGFHHMLLPRLEDTDYQGYLLPVSSCRSPYELLEHSFRCIRSLFFKESVGVLHVLPQLPSECASGSLLDVTTSKGHKLSIEWRAHTLRRVQLVAAVDDEVTFEFQKQITSFRLGNSRFSGGIVKVRAGSTYLLDNFHK